MYSVADYLWMIADETRVSAYATALRALVRPGDRVLEIGAGFGFFSVVVTRAGAAHVDAVEINPTVHLGPKVAAQNRCADRITFHHADATRITLDTPADLLLLDLRGPTPFGSRSLDVLIDARSRLLRPGGTIVAARDTVFVAPVRAPAVFRREVQAARGRENVAMTAVERVVYDTPMRCSITPAELVTPGLPWTEIDYYTVDSSDRIGTAEWTVERADEIGGLAIWFESDLGAGVKYSSAPCDGVSAYRQVFLPFQHPVAVEQGDHMRVRLAARQAHDRYVWEWKVWLTPPSAINERPVVSQNSLAELVIDPAALVHTSGDAVPVLGARGRALQYLLAHIDGERTVSQLAALVRDEVPGAYPCARDATSFVSDWIARVDRFERGTE